MKKKVVWLPYDMDTAIGINNEGGLVFSYNLEDTDHLAGGANIFNGQDSVLWNNVRLAFFDELKSMYQRLRSQGVLSYDKVEEMFEEHQSKWPEAIFNEDAYFKYIMPLIESGTATYLDMLQGSKAEQRKWWLYNRFRYIDSKYNAGDALSDFITLRGYAAADITVIPYADIYPAVKYGSYLVSTRGERNKATTLVNPLETLNDTEIAIYSSSQLASVGDLSPLKVGLADFSMATKLQAIKIGDADSSYQNTNLASLSLGNNVLLKTLDVRNCVGLGDTSLEGHTQTAVDISGCEIIEEVYFDGTKIKGLTLPNGGVLKVLHLPATITNLTIRNQKAITDLSIASYDSITTLWLENLPTVNTKAIFNRMTATTRVRLIGFQWEAADAAEIEALLDKLDTMRGLDESGNNVETAQVSGTIHTSSLTGAQIASFNERYPYLTVKADYAESVLTYMSYDGASTIKTVVCLNGVPQEAAPSVPTRANSSDGHYSYTGIGWNTEMDSQTADPSAIKDVIADRTVYAAYTWTVRTYTVYWQNAGSTIETDTNVPWGTVPHYDGSTPTKDGQTSTGWLPDPTQPITGNTTFVAQYLPVYTVTFKNDTGSTTLDTQQVRQGDTATYGGTTPTSSEDASLAFLGWATSANSHKADAVLTNVQSSMIVYAAFESAVEVAEITDDWDTIIANIDNGTYSTKYKIGNYKPLNAGDWDGNATTLNMQIVAFDQDVDANGNTVPITFISKELIPNSWAISNYTIFPVCLSNITGKMPQTVLSRVNSVIKDRASSSSLVSETVKFWIPSAKEVGYGKYAKYQELSTHDYAMFKNNENRIKTHNSSNEKWQLRSVDKNGDLIAINANGGMMTSTKNYYVLGFCLGLESETITDSWETILANETPSATYSIGDTKMIDLGTEGKHLMEIVAFDADDKADGSGKAKITWISKDLLNTTHGMNPANSSGAIGTGGNGGWENCEMRTYLKETIKPLIPETVRNAIVSVTKVQSTVTDGTMVKDGQTTTEDVWIPSTHEVGSSNNYESTGAVYTTKFNGASARIKKRNGSASSWWTRSAYSTTYWRRVSMNGGDDYYDSYRTIGVALGFCTN